MTRSKLLITFATDYLFDGSTILVFMQLQLCGGETATTLSIRNERIRHFRVYAVLSATIVKKDLSSQLNPPSSRSIAKMTQ